MNIADNITPQASTALSTHNMVKNHHVILQEMPLINKISLRCKDYNHANAIVKDICGVGLERYFNKFREYDGHYSHRIGPDEWLLYINHQDISDIINNLHVALSNTHYAIVDVSDYYGVIRLQGVGAKNIIQQGCPLDLRQQSANKSFCGGSLYHNAPIFLMVRDYNNIYDIQCRWSFCDYLYRHFATAITA